jgi:uncharacterized protein (TIGR03437 family)
VAWAALSLLNLWEVTQEAQYLQGAQKLGSWVLTNTSDINRGQGGFTGGNDGWEIGGLAAGETCPSSLFSSGQCIRLYKSTEHNIDLYALFSRLYLADGSSTWAIGAQQAKHFVLAMWDPQEQKFWTGTTEDGITISKDVIPLDIQAWALAALGTESQPFQGSLAYVEAHHKTALGYGFKQNGGNVCGDRTWFEGTAQVADAYWLVGNAAKWQSILSGIHSAQISDGAVPATDGDCLNTGFTLNDGSPWEYYPRAHVGATGWLSLAETGFNPYRADLYSPGLSTQSIAFGSQTVGLTGSPQLLTFMNRGTATVTLKSLTISGANVADFRQSNTCGTTLAAGQNCTISVLFSPTAQGIRTATLVLSETSDPAMAPVAYPVALSGVGVTSATSYSLTLSALPPSGGSVNAAPSSANGSYPQGTQVCLTATPAAGWSFAGWSGDALDANNCLTMNANRSVTANFTQAAAANLQVLSISPYGASPGTITGRVTGGDPSSLQVTALDFVSGQGWFTKPTCASPATALAQDGSFSVLLTTGGQDPYSTRVAVLVLPASVSVGCYTQSSGLPPELTRQALAQTVIIRPNPQERELTFAGQPWAVKASQAPVGPGNCIFSDSPDSVFLDSQGQLHLRVVNKNGTWSCAEVYSRAAVGYGVYRWTLASAPALDPSVVMGSFTWADAQANARELDVEFGFSQAGGTTNSQFVVQPASQVGNLQRITIPASGPVTFKMTWLPTGILFQAFLGVDDTGIKLQEWTYGGTPVPADQSYENFRFNLWLNGSPPASGQTREAVVSNFAYEPYVSDPTAPVATTLVNGASFLPGVSPGSAFSLFGQTLASQVLQAGGYPLPLSLGNVSVTVNGLTAPLFFASQGQINGQIPYLTPLGPSLAQVTVGGEVSQMLPFNNLPAAPGMFENSGLNCLVQNQDMTLNSPSKPAKLGSIVTTYLTGIGMVDNPVPTAAAAPLSPLSRPLLPQTAQIDGNSATLSFLGLAPLMVAVGQANIQIPPDARPGVRPLVIDVGGVDSNACTLFIGDVILAPPVITGAAPSSGPAAGGTSLAISGQGFQNGATVRFGKQAAPSVTFSGPTSLSAVTPPGSGTVDVTVSNPDGQTAALANGFTYQMAPSVSNIAPATGPIAGGTSVTIQGANFVNGATVKLGTVVAGQVVVVNSTTITAVCGGSGAGVVDVVVTNPDGQSGKLTQGFTYAVPPTITSISPGSGVQSGGTAVTILGQGFASGAAVRFGSASATVLQVQAGQIQVTTPPGSGTVGVTVTNPNGLSATLPNAFTYGSAIHILSIQPSQGVNTGGTAITVTGTGLVPGCTLTIGTVAAYGVNVVSGTTITALTGSTSATGVFDVVVTPPNGQPATLPGGFTYTSPPLRPPHPTSISVSSGPATGNTPLTVSGDSFAGGAQVRIGGFAATVQQVTANQISIVTGASTAIGPMDVVVTNPDGQSGSLPAAFTYTLAISNPQIHGATQGCSVSGSVSGVAPTSQFGVVVYAYTDQYYVQACIGDPLASISPSGAWGPVSLHSGTISVLLVRQGYVPASTLQNLPTSDGFNVFAVLPSFSTVSGCDVPRCPAQ